MTKKRIVLIPFWVQEALVRNNLPISDCLDFGKLRPIMSLNDLVAFSTTQQYFKQLLGADIIGDELFWVWLQSIPEGQPELKKFLTDSVTALANDGSFHMEVRSRLFDPDAKTSQYENAFITYDLTPEVCGVVIYPGFFVGEGNTELQQAIVDAILKVLYVYEPSHEVAKTPLFKRYLELLSVNQKR